MLITPLVACITLGSICNGRLLTRVPNPMYLMYAGLTLLALSGIGITTLRQATSHALMACYMAGSGFGLGLVLPNLTIFTQEAAGRAHLGIATAMIQSLRMVGGMLGTAVVGALVNHLYVSRVQVALESAHASQWVARLSDPQILINKAAQHQMAAQLHEIDQYGISLIEMARASLVSSIHLGQMLSVAVTVVAALLIHRIPRLQLHRKTEQKAT